MVVESRIFTLATRSRDKKFVHDMMSKHVLRRRVKSHRSSSRYAHDTIPVSPPTADEPY